jgi:hypothetical protein
MRWPDGVRCPVCGNDKISRVTREAKSKNKRNRIYTCLEKSCKSQFSATAGTVFHNSHLPLTKWLMAIAIVMDAKKGMSALQLQEHLGIGSYRTAWYMVHRIRKAMVELFPTKLSGIVEVDETYIGGKSKRRGHAARKCEPLPKKDMVIGLRERGGRVRFFHVPNLKADTIKKILDRHIAVDTKRIITGSAMVYPFAMDKNFQKKHDTVNHSREWVKPGDIEVHTNTVESAFSLLKRGIIGSFHRVSIKHLYRYLAEFQNRFNMRNGGNRFGQTVRRMLTTEQMEYKQLIADPVEA